MSKTFASYTLFLFDFDGLLVNTEKLQFQAYQGLCSAYGVDLPWDFSTYCQIAHQSISLFRTELFRVLPELKSKESNWEILYPKKFQIYTELLKTHPVELMPGAERFLSHLQEEQIKHAVVTHSSFEHFDLICKQHPILKRIPYTTTRADYHHPKPHPECYQLSIERFGKKGEKCIGFEDSPRGVRALMGSGAKPLLITTHAYADLQDLEEAGVEIYSSLDAAYSTLMRNNP